MNKRDSHLCIIISLLFLLLCACNQADRSSSDALCEKTLFRWEESQSSDIVYSDGQLYCVQETDPVNLFYQQIARCTDRGEAEPVCSLLGCDHASINCQANFRQIGDFFEIDNTIYVLAEKDSMNGPVLYRLESDGTEREELLRIRENVSNSTRFGIAVLGYTEDTLIFSVPYASKEAYEAQEPSEKMYSLALETGASPREISLDSLRRDTDHYGKIQSACCDEEALYFTMSCGDSGAQRSYAAEVSLENGKVKILYESDEKVCSLCRSEDLLFLSCGTSVYQIDPETGKAEILTADLERESYEVRGIFDGKLYAYQNGILIGRDLGNLSDEWKIIKE